MNLLVKSLKRGGRVRAFTLIELLAVILIIIGILIAVAAPTSRAGANDPIPPFEVTSTNGSVLVCQVGTTLCPFRLVGHGVRTDTTRGGIAAQANGAAQVVGADGTIGSDEAASFDYRGAYRCTSVGSGSIRALWQAGPGNDPGALAEGIAVSCVE